MRSEILKQLLAEYDQLQQQNWQEELERRQEIAGKIPEIIRLMDERQRLISDGIMGLLRGSGSMESAPEKMELLTGRIRSLLKANGLPEDYLDPIYRCKICRDKGYAGEPVREMCSCLRTQFYQRLYQSIGLDTNHAQSFEDFDLNVFPDTLLPGKQYSQRKLMDRIRQLCLEWTEACPQAQPRDLLLMGQSGLGKTYLMQAMARRLLQRGKNVLLISAYSFLDTARRAYFSQKTDELDDILYADVLMIDDMGSEPLMENITIVQWFNLIDQRQRLNLPTVISTNLQQNELRERYTERIASRLTDQHQCRLLLFLGEDVRRK